MTSQALVLRSDDECFALAERIKTVNVVPAAYRGKPADIAVAIMYGQELGLSPMTSLQQVIVIEGKPTLSAQGMSAVIRQAGHSISGSHDANGAALTGTRGDNGDTMTVTFTIEDAKRAGLATKNVWKAYPGAMCWARCVSQIGRDLFADCLLGFAYTPEEADFDGTTDYSMQGAQPGPVATATVDKPEPVAVRRTSPVSAAPPEGFGVAATGTGTTDDDIAEAEIVEDDDTDPAGSFAAAVGLVVEAFGLAEQGEVPVFIPASESDPITPKEATTIKKLLAKLNPPIRATADVNKHVAGLVQHELVGLTDLSRSEYETVMSILEGA